jgi:AcrR family transcriptional regulator
VDETETPASVRIAAELRRRIDSGQLGPGMRMPSTRALMQRHGVAMATATKALTMLRQEGLTRSVPGVGTLVAPATPAPAPPGTGTGSGGRRGTGTPFLTPDAIVTAAVDVADREGLSGLSMRRVAVELDAAPMSLYRHVKDKDELLLHMMEAALAEGVLPAVPPSSWREGVQLAARTMWTTFRRHPWLASALSLTRPQVLQGALVYSDWVLAVLSRVGLDPLTTFTAHLTIFTFVRGTAMNLELESDAEAASGLSSEDWTASQEPALERILSDGQHPHFARVLRSMDFDLDLDELFEFGLDRLLDGIAVLAGNPGAQSG